MEIEGRTASSRQGCFGPRSSFYLNGMAHSGRKAGGTVTFWFMNMGRENSVEWGLLDNNARSKKKHGNAGRRFLKNMIVLRTLF